MRTGRSATAPRRKNLLKNTFFGKYSDYYMDGDAAGANILCCCMGICLTPNLEKVNGRFVAGGPMTLCCCIETRDINNCKSAQTVRPIWDIVAGGGSHPNRPGNLNFLPPSIRTTYSKHTDVQTTVVIDGTDSRTHAEYQETTLPWLSLSRIIDTRRIFEHRVNYRVN
eukprot:COSAG01_NODE_17180_length_1172_cov_4.488350_2_plen_168_part_00